MTHWLDQTLVGILLTASAGYALMSLGPRVLRLRVLALLARAAAHAPRSVRLSGLANKFAAAAVEKPKGACGSCGNCGAGAAATPTPAEIKIPVGKIGRRA